MQNYKIIIQYDGTKYNGWQKQGNTDNTIQGKLESILSRLDENEVIVNGSGRTDAGTHAKGQVASFRLEKKLEPKKILEYLNNYLPRDIAVIKAEYASERFHARLNARAKKYLYTISYGVYEDVFERKYHWRLNENLDIEKMIKASKYFIGTHDFKAFCSNKKFKKSTIREIYDIQITNDSEKGELKLLFYGNGFLYNMVRIIVGTIVEVGLNERKLEDVEKLLTADKRMFSGKTSPACGLCLMEVEY